MCDKFDMLLKDERYNSFFVRNNLTKDRIVFLVYGGSVSYGTNVKTSDVDIRGVYMPTFEEIIWGTQDKTLRSNETDTELHSFSHFLKLASKCSPNILEMLFCKPESYLYISPLGKLLLENKELFLSKNVLRTYKGYRCGILDEIAKLPYVKKTESEKMRLISKNMMHLIRIYLNEIEILESGTLHTFITNEHELLMNIRAGKYLCSDYTFKKQFVELMHNLEKRVLELSEKTILSSVCDENKITEICKIIYKKYYQLED